MQGGCPTPDTIARQMSQATNIEKLNEHFSFTFDQLITMASNWLGVSLSRSSPRRQTLGCSTCLLKAPPSEPSPNLHHRDRSSNIASTSSKMNKIHFGQKPEASTCTMSANAEIKEVMKPNSAQRFVQKTKQLFSRTSKAPQTSRVLPPGFHDLRSQFSYSTQPRAIPGYVEHLSNQITAIQALLTHNALAPVQNESNNLGSPPDLDQVSSISTELGSDELDLELPPPVLDLNPSYSAFEDRISHQALPEFNHVISDGQGILLEHTERQDFLVSNTAVCLLSHGSS